MMTEATVIHLREKIQLTLLLIVTVTISTFIYVFFNGTPWRQHQFKNELRQYLATRPFSNEIQSQTIDYDFKEEEYLARVVLTNNLSVVVHKNSLHWIDTYAQSVIANEVEQTVLQEFSSVYPDIEVSADVKDNLIEFEEHQVPSYRLLSKKEKESVHIKIVERGTKEEEHFQECFDFVRWAIKNEYSFSYFFVFNDKEILISQEDLKKVKQWEDVKEFVLE